MRRIEPPHVTFHCPKGTLRARFLLAGWGTLHHGHGNADQHQCLLESGFRCALACSLYLSLNFHPSPHWGLTLLSQLWLGGGIRLWGTIVVANFTGCNIHDNEAWGYVCSPSALLPSRFLHRPDGTLRAPIFGLQGGGVSVRNGMQGSRMDIVGGVANFEHCNIHENTAPNVCLHL